MVAFFKSSDHFMVFLFLSITFDSSLDDVLSFWVNPDIQDGDQDGRHSEMITQLLRHVAS